MASRHDPGWSGVTDAGIELPRDGPPTTTTAAVGVRSVTRESRCDAVERVIRAMEMRVAEPLSLEEMARIAMFSPYHFHRIFRLVTGIPPAQFLTALRMAKACRLLLTTSMRVTDVCFEVGFGSLGTFTTRFGQLVGAAPQQLRWMADQHADLALETLLTPPAAAAAPAAGGDIVGWITTPGDLDFITMLGLFPRASPHGLPIACAAVRAPGPFRLTSVPAGHYRALALGFPPESSVLEAALLDPQTLLVAMPAVVRMDLGRSATVQLRLRRPSPVDPPVVLAAPILLAQRGEVDRSWPEESRLARSQSTQSTELAR